MSKLTKALTAAAGNAGGDNLYVEDVFSTYLYDGSGTGQAIENGINLGDANVGGSGYFDGTGDYLTAPANNVFAFNTGDFTIESWVYITATKNQGIFDTRNSGPSSTGIVFSINASNSLDVYIGGTILTSSASLSLNTWTHVACVKSSGTITIYIDGVARGSVSNSTNLTNTTPTVGTVFDYRNTGSTYMLQGYLSNLRIVNGTAVYTSAFTPSTAPLTAISGTALLTLQSPEPFTDNSGNSLAITQVGNVKAQNFGPFTSDEAGAGGMVWSKTRDTDVRHGLVDTERGAAEMLTPDENWANQTTTDSTLSFNSNGYTLGADAGNQRVNNSAYDYVGWTFRKAEKFFDVVTYTGTGSARTVSHNLGSVPAVMIIKRTSTSGSNWRVYHTSLGNGQALSLNTTDAAGATTSLWNSTTPTDSVFTLGDNGNVNQSGQSFVAYLFASDAGGFGDDGSESVVKCGSYTYSTGLEVNIGFEPQWILYKTVGIADNWTMLDTMRGWTVTGDNWLRANSSNAEGSNFDFMNPTATGFKVNDGSVGEEYIYIAIRRPMKTPESGTEVFLASTVASGVQIATGFNVDLWINGSKDGSAGVSSQLTMDRMRGAKYLRTTQTTAETSTNNPFTTGPSNTFTNITQGGAGVAWMFKRATGFMDVVCYSGTGSQGYQVNHNLGVIPELIIIKRRNNASAEGWFVGTEFSATNFTQAKLNVTDTAVNSLAYTSSSIFRAQPTTTNFTLGNYQDVNNSSSDTYIAYLFATLAGVSKVGSYTGTGSNVDVDCGFSAGARFILIKRTDSTGDWYVWDSVRGIVAGNDPYLLLNSTAAQVTNTDYVDPLASGFTVTSTAPAALNASGGSYIFLAIA